MSENKIELSGILAEGYGIIPKKLMRAKELDVYQKAILAYFLSYTGGGNSCFPSIALIAQDLQISKTTAVNKISNLEKKGYISKQQLYPDNPLNHANKYTLNFILNNKNYKITVFEPRNTCKCTTDIPAGETSIVQELVQNKNTNNNNNNNNIYISEIYNYYISKNIIKHIKLTDYFKTKIKSVLKNYSKKDILSAIDNYVYVLSDENSYFTHKWAIDEFLQRGLGKFFDKASRDNFKKNGKQPKEEQTGKGW